jgi:ComF family protein
MLDTLLSVVAPHLCSGCGEIGATFCDNCKYDISVEPFSQCVLCDKPAASGVCNDHKVAFNQAWVVGIRNGALQRLIGGFKFRNMKSAGRELAQLLHARLPVLPLSVVFVPIPTTSAHIRERGYDHMLLIAYELGRLRGLPVEILLQRNNSLTQHHANRRQRLVQAESAFRLSGEIDPRKIYIVIDDIVTTGATIQQRDYSIRLGQPSGSRQSHVNHSTDQLVSVKIAKVLPLEG